MPLAFVYFAGILAFALFAIIVPIYRGLSETMIAIYTLCIVITGTLDSIKYWRRARNR